jgi:hypothetical protein
MTRLLLVLLLLWVRTAAPIADARAEADSPTAIVFCAPESADHSPAHDPLACAACSALGAHFLSTTLHDPPFAGAVRCSDDAIFIDTIHLAASRRFTLARAPPVAS